MSEHPFSAGLWSGDMLGGRKEAFWGGGRTERGGSKTPVKVICTYIEASFLHRLSYQSKKEYTIVGLFFYRVKGQTWYMQGSHGRCSGTVGALLMQAAEDWEVMQLYGAKSAIIS